MTSQSTNYLVAVLTNRLQAEAAYRSLKSADLPIEDVAILGQGYRSADDYGLINPDDEAQKQTQSLRAWLLPFGFAAGFAFNWLTGIEITSWVGDFGNHCLGGLLGLGAGAIGAAMTGRLTGWTVASSDAIAYRNRINAGKYILIATGPGAFVRDATQRLRQFNPENLQGYVEPT